MKLKFFALIILFFVLAICALMNGPMDIGFSSIFGFVPTGVESGDELQIILNYRWSKVIMAITACGGLAIAGLLMQTYFQNPLAGPDVFGLTSGASLGVALAIFAQSSLFQFTSLELNFLGFGLEAIAAFVGAFLTFLLISLLSIKFRSKTVLLILGLLMASFLSGFLSLLVSLSNKDELRDFISWGLGSFEKLNLIQAIFMLIAVLFISALVFFMSKALNVFYLGEKYASTSGVNVKKFKGNVILATCVLTALITAACGPLAFVGVVAAHASRAFFKTSHHKILVPGTLLIGANFGLVVILFLSFRFSLPLPANAIMGFLGAPLLLFFLLRKEHKHL